MATNDETDEKLDAEIDEKLDDLDIVRAIEDKDAPYVIVQIRGLIKDAKAEGYKEGQKDAAQQIFEELDKIITLFPNDTDQPDIKVIFPEGYDYKALKKKYRAD